MIAWVFAGVCLIFYLGGAWFFGSRARGRKVAELLGRRANPTRDEFVAMMTVNARPDVAAFLWDALQLYYRPELTPHPDDDLVGDLLIDPDEPEDWVMDYCHRFAISAQELPKWGEEHRVTPRNLGRYLATLPR
ncbi:hypothetical protein [Croceicoccus mobilis]|uniref:Uncharacterized protein n=1 Tax=Croceicoccus mobilis TaxID=1703339 RepID=A0A917DS27_9SPHN|nr:hypothetical protein [Croceicoccus mobilis]GGD61290.1 hypothetical protein GCM10010990_08500 [Croceicoccus mobilis]